jgi:hypothetical protein
MAEHEGALITRSAQNGVGMVRMHDHDHAHSEIEDVSHFLLLNQSGVLNKSEDLGNVPRAPFNL